jgi:hypothetical protein
MISFVCELLLVGDFHMDLWFAPAIKLIATI